jgi:hypothetical protein
MAQSTEVSNDAMRFGSFAWLGGRVAANRLRAFYAEI